MTVAIATTPASYFHLLRRQALTSTPRPLVVFTPKSLLRLRAALSAVEDITEAAFAPVLPDPGLAGRPLDRAGVRRVALCTGKVFYDLAAWRQRHEIADTALVRIEQLYPLPADAIRATLGGVDGATEFVWVQEEPENMGAWSYMSLHLPAVLPGGADLSVRSRPASASPAAGSSKVHEEQQQALIESVFG